MTTITPPSLYNSNLKKANTSHLFQTPVFGNKDPESETLQDDACTSSKKKVVFTSKNNKNNNKAINDTSLIQKTLFVTNDSTCCSTSSSTVRTISKNNSDGSQSKETRRAGSFVSTMVSTPSTLPKKGNAVDAGIEPPKYGKRKIEFIGFDDDSAEEELEAANADLNKENIVGTTTTALTSTIKKHTKQVKLSLQPTPIVTDLYLFNTARTKMYRFPVFKDSDLKIPGEWQNKLRDTDIDNDCETENDILDYSIMQVKKDLAKALQMQKDEEAKGLKTEQKTGKFVSYSQDTAKKNESSQNENIKKEEGVSFWKDVAQTFKELVGGPEKRKST